MLSKIRKKLSRKVSTLMLPLIPVSILGDLGSILDRIFYICVVLLIIVLILIGAWILSHFFGTGGGRG